MAGELEAVATEMIEALDSMNLDRMVRGFGVDVVSVDEISREWLYGRDAVETYLGGLIDTVSDVQTELRDSREAIWGETGILTCWMEQDYTHDDHTHHVSAPTTMVFRKEGSEWKIVLFHSIPLPDES